MIMIGTTFGFPVVPEEKLRNASLVLASPALSLPSTKEGLITSPRFTKSSTVVNPVVRCVDEETLRGTIRSGGSPASRAAASAVPNESG